MSTSPPGGGNGAIARMPKFGMPIFNRSIDSARSSTAKRGGSIQNRLFGAYTLMMLLMLAVFLALFYAYNSRLLRGRATDEMKTLTTVSMNAVDNEFRKMDTVAMNISYSNLIKDQYEAYRSSSATTESPSLSEAERFNRAKALADLFIAISGPNRTVQQINLYEPEGSMIGAGVYTQAVSTDIHAKPWYDAVMARNGARLLVEPHDDPLLRTDRNLRRSRVYVSLCRMYFSTGRKFAGIIEIKQDWETVFSSLTEQVAERTDAPDVRVYSDNGIQVFPLPSGIVPAAPGAAFSYMPLLTPAAGDETVTDLIEGQDGREIVTHVTSSWSGYTTVIIRPERELFAPIFAFSRLFLLVSAALLLMSMWISYVLARKLTTPIRKLHAAIRSLDLADLPDSPPRPMTSVNELESLNAAFGSMNQRLRQSLSALLLSKTHETQARMMALQAQMDPHFYHNTLSTISIMAEEGMNDRIVEMCRHLSFMMRYIANEAQTTVLLGEDLAYAERYLDCMKIRYGNDLSFMVDVPEEMRDLTVPKLIIQPLVENALKYGIQKDPPWTVRITGSCTETAWRISVSDDGPGFTPESIACVARVSAQYLDRQEVPELGINGMGLVNTRLRLAMHGREESFFEMANLPEGGAIVTIGASRGEEPA